MMMPTERIILDDDDDVESTKETISELARVIQLDCLSFFEEARERNSNLFASESRKRPLMSLVEREDACSSKSQKRIARVSSAISCQQLSFSPARICLWQDALSQSNARQNIELEDKRPKSSQSRSLRGKTTECRRTC